MAVTDLEATHAYETLVHAATSAGLSWIVREVEEEAALGHVELKSLRLVETEPELFAGTDSPLKQGEMRGASRAAFSVSRPLTPQERLLSLVEGLEVGVVELNQVALEVVQFFQEELSEDHVVLASEGNAEEVTDVSRSELQVRSEATSRLAALLAELKKEI